MRILLTGAAGFIGFHLFRKLAEEGHEVMGLDNMNAYYNPQLKIDRLNEMEIDFSESDDFHRFYRSEKYPLVRFVRSNLTDRPFLDELFLRERFEVVVHLAAQAGVRYSLEKPDVYVQSNVDGFFSILENCRHHGIGHLIYASSSSVYGLNETVPFSTEQKTDRPISLYAATKKTNELMAHAYSHLFRIPTTGLRFFTVYGPWGRPDMALYLFTSSIFEGKPIKLFNDGKLSRDFTYVGDIVEGLGRIINDKDVGNRVELYRLYNIGKGTPIPLMEFVKELENQIGKMAIKDFLPMQPGDVLQTWADTAGLQKDYSYHPTTTIQEGVRQYLEWYRGYYLSD